MSFVRAEMEGLGNYRGKYILARPGALYDRDTEDPQRVHFRRSIREFKEERRRFRRL
jgi:hypothetical protein